MRCEKCGYESEENKEILAGRFLCSICRTFIPEEEYLEEYINEKIDSRVLESFRKFKNDKNEKGMENKAKQGRIMSRAPYGYKIENKELVVEEEKSLIVQKIFMDFLNNEISLNQLSKNYNFSVNGIKKILKNFTYLGKIKFSGQILPGKHPAIISSELFNKVQKKLEN